MRLSDWWADCMSQRGIKASMRSCTPHGYWNFWVFQPALSLADPLQRTSSQAQDSKWARSAHQLCCDCEIWSSYCEPLVRDALALQAATGSCRNLFVSTPCSARVLTFYHRFRYCSRGQPLPRQGRHPRMQSSTFLEIFSSSTSLGTWQCPK